MRVWRLCAHAHAASLAGLGGLYAGGRWHHKGQPIVYTSSTPSLAALEFLVHVDPSLAPPELRLLEIEIPEALDIEICAPTRLTLDWQKYPAPRALQNFGTQWLSSLRSGVLRVPSAVIAVEYNYLLNPQHPEAARVQIVQDRLFSFDTRLLQPRGLLARPFPPRG